MNRSCLLCCCLLVVLACSETTEDTTDPPNEDFDGLRLSALRWNFTWDLDSVAISPEGWSTTNDLGVTFTVTSGWLSSYSASLAPCLVEEEVEWAKRGLIEQFFSIGTARADHAVDIDPSSLPSPILEDLVTLEPSQSSSLAFEETLYCQLHYLIARADIGTPDPSPETSMSLVTLRLGGFWEDGAASGPLDVVSSFNYGSLSSLGEATAPPSTNQVLIELRRSAAGLFTGVSPSLLSPEELAWEVSQNIVDGTECIFNEAQFIAEE
jgi:hypothetical protein